MNERFALSGSSDATITPLAPEDEEPPICPSCQQRLVMLAMHWVKDERGVSVRRQLWGCPRGHATAYRTHGRFMSIELLETLGD